MSKNISWGFPLVLCWVAAVDTNQGVEKSLDQKCVAKTEPSKCMFPQEFLKNIRTPVFLVNPAYDFWQVRVANPSMSSTYCLLPLDLTPIHVYCFTNTKHTFRFNMSWYQLLRIQIKVGQSADSILRNVMPNRLKFYTVIYSLIKINDAKQG